MPDSINFAEYHDGNILISKRLLEVLEQKKELLRAGLGDFKVWDVLFYHELYHHFEDIEDHL